MDNQLRIEDIRHAVRAHLAARPGLAQLPATIRRGINREITEPTEREVKDALIFLTGLKQVEPVTDSLGATQYYQITATGTLAHERS